MASHVFQPPTGTRDLYPIEAARRRFIMEAWRRVSINHGFEEIDGPTFEHLDLYKVKSGEGIVNELFSFTRAGGEKDYALRPEFTPTLARMYAAKAASLPKPTKWFTAGPFFRAERPQRGRLREFLQWNCDVMGDGSPQADSEVIACCIGLLETVGLTSDQVKVRMGHRGAVADLIRDAGVREESVEPCLMYLDGANKRSASENAEIRAKYGITSEIEERLAQHHEKARKLQASGDFTVEKLGVNSASMKAVVDAYRELEQLGLAEWCVPLDLTVVRGLAYYTGMVFEVIVDGERAVAGGGRYDNLIELFGGPPTPAVGFGMGDVVLSLVLQDKGLMPSDDELLGLAGQNPDVFIISNGTPEADGAVPGVLAALRRGEPRAPASNAPPLAGLHARRSYKTTKNVGKLLQDAVKARARFAVIIESATEATIKDLKSGIQDQHKTPLAALVTEIRARRGT